MGATTINLRVPENHDCFSGHFPGNPIVPGALLIEWLITNVTSRLDGREVNGLSSIKFLSSLKPGDDFELQFDVPSTGSKLRVSCLNGDALVCKAVLVLDSVE